MKARLYASSNQRNISSLISITSSLSRSDISLPHYWQKLEEEQNVLYLGQVKRHIRSPSHNRFISLLYSGRLQKITKGMNPTDFGAKNHLWWKKSEQIMFCRFVCSTGSDILKRESCSPYQEWQMVQEHLLMNGKISAKVVIIRQDVFCMCIVFRSCQDFLCSFFIIQLLSVQDQKGISSL